MCVWAILQYYWCNTGLRGDSDSTHCTAHNYNGINNHKRTSDCTYCTTNNIHCIFYNHLRTSNSSNGSTYRAFDNHYGSDNDNGSVHNNHSNNHYSGNNYKSCNRNPHVDPMFRNRLLSRSFQLSLLP
jgi:hypothetical protein